MPAATLSHLKATAELRPAPECVLRSLHEDDVTQAYVDGLNDPVVNRFLVGSRSQLQTVASVRDYVRANRESDLDILFGMFIDDELRGTVRLHDVDLVGRLARIGVLVFDRAYWGQRWATRTIDAIIEFVGRELNISRFWAGMRADNVVSRRTFEALGFVYQPTVDWTDEEGGLHRFFLLTLERNPR